MSEAQRASEEILRKDIELLHRIAKELLKYETVDSKDLGKILKGQRLTRRLNGSNNSRKKPKQKKHIRTRVIINRITSEIKTKN